MAIITTPTMKQIDFAKHMLEITSITTVGYGDPSLATEVQSLLDDISCAAGVTLHIGGVPSKHEGNIDARLTPSTVPHKSHDQSRTKS